MAQQPHPGLLLHYQPLVDNTGRTIRLGEGGFATVYRYRNINTNEEVAIKRMKLTGLSMDKAELVIKYMPSE